MLTKRWRIAAMAILQLPTSLQATPAKSSDDVGSSPTASKATITDEIPANFRGRVTYTGSYDGRVVVPGQAPRKLNFSSILQQALNTKTIAISGNYVVRLELIGSKITGELETTGSLNSAHLTGLREGTVCHLLASDGSRSDVYCGRQRYEEHVDQTNPRGQHVAYVATGRVSEIVNYLKQERERALAAKASEERRAAEVAALAAADQANKAWIGHPATARLVNGKMLWEALGYGWPTNARSRSSVRYQTGLDGDAYYVWDSWTGKTDKTRVFVNRSDSISFETEGSEARSCQDADKNGSGEYCYYSALTPAAALKLSDAALYAQIRQDIRAGNAVTVASSGGNRSYTGARSDNGASAHFQAAQETFDSVRNTQQIERDVRAGTIFEQPGDRDPH